jgi:hypothetical protein
MPVFRGDVYLVARHQYSTKQCGTTSPGANDEERLDVFVAVYRDGGGSSQQSPKYTAAFGELAD